MCKAVCELYPFKKRGNASYYHSGASRCNGRCGGVWLKWDGLWCPCCGYRLRKNPRNKKSVLQVQRIEKSRIN